MSSHPALRKYNVTLGKIHPHLKKISIGYEYGDSGRSFYGATWSPDTIRKEIYNDRFGLPAPHNPLVTLHKAHIGRSVGEIMVDKRIPVVLSNDYIQHFEKLTVLHEAAHVLDLHLNSRSLDSTQVHDAYFQNLHRIVMMKAHGSHILKEREIDLLNYLDNVYRAKDHHTLTVDFHDTLDDHRLETPVNDENVSLLSMNDSQSLLKMSFPLRREVELSLLQKS